MNKIIKTFILFGISISSLITPVRSEAQLIAIIKETAIKAIKALDLQVQRLQNATIDLQNVQKQIENVLSKLKLQEIADWTEKQKVIYEQYFEELWRAKSLITYYSRITGIINKQKRLITEYRQAFELIKKDKHFTNEEVAYIYSVYSGIIDKSIVSVDQIFLMIQSFTVQMSDAQRLTLLSRSADEIDTYIRDLQIFTNKNIQVSLQRSKSLQDVNDIRTLYGITR